MKTQKKYDPEDIESLLQHKSFDELYPEERAFVLNHMESPEEYASMRQTLLELQSIDWDKDGIEPRKEIKERLMEEFAVERKGGFIIWLNTLFAQGKSVSWYRSGGFQVAMGVLVLALVGTWFFTTQSTNQDMIAEVKQDVELAPTTVAADSVENESQNSTELNPQLGAIEATEDATVTSTLEDDEFEIQDEQYRKSVEVTENVHEEGRESFALVAENEATLGKDHIQGDQATFDTPSGEIKDLTVSDIQEDIVSVDAAKAVAERKIAQAPTTEEEKALDADDVAYSEEVFTDQIEMDNSMGNSVPATIALESARIESTQDFNASEITVNEISTVKAAEGQSIRRYKGLLDELYTSR